MKATFSASIFIIASICVCVSASVGCLDQSGNPVDWWVALKAPKNTDYDDASSSGYGYAYADTNSQTITWTGKRFDQSSGALDKTLDQIYKHKSAVGYAMYNDEDPDTGKSHESFGHTKGVVAFDADSGFWLVHSVPQFPPSAADGWSYIERASIKGQSFLCISMSAGTLDKSISGFLLNKPYVYDYNFPDKLAPRMKNFQSVINEEWRTSSASTNFTISSSKSTQFVVFAKNKEADVALWDDLVAPYYASGIYVETWMDGAIDNKMKSACPPHVAYKTLNVKTVTLKSGLSWDETKDHSKWAVAIDRPGIFCIGDINRQKSQANRGGGTVCTNIGTVAKSFLKFVSDFENCRGRSY